MMNETYIPHSWHSGNPLPLQRRKSGRKHIYTARAFDKDHTYVIHKAHIEGREAVRTFKREARAQYKSINHWRVYDETSQRTVEK